jgi:Sortase domain
VPGAEGGNELADGLGDGDGLGLGVAGVGVGVAGVGVVAPGTVTPGGVVLGVGVLDGAALGAVVAGGLVPGVLVPGVGVLGPLPGAVALGVPLAETAGVAVLVRPGGNDGGVVDGELDEQADSAALASTARAAPPRTAERRRAHKQDQRALQTRNGFFITVIPGYAGRTPRGRQGDGMGHARWRRIAGFRVVMSWPESGFTPPPSRPPRPPRPGSLRARISGVASVLLIVTGAAAVGIAVAAQQHAPQPSAAAAGATGPSAGRAWWQSLRRSIPVSVGIPAIGVHAVLLRLGVRPNGAMQVPPLQQPGVAAWYKYSVTPGQLGTSVIEGHVDNEHGAAVFFRLGALRPGDLVNVRLADGITAIFRVTGVRQYLKSTFPAKAVYRATRFAALRLITCGGAFDYATSQYLSSTVVFAFLVSARPAVHRKPADASGGQPRRRISQAATSARPGARGLAAGRTAPARNP